MYSVYNMGAGMIVVVGKESQSIRRSHAEGEELRAAGRLLQAASSSLESDSPAQSAPKKMEPNTNLKGKTIEELKSLFESLNSRATARSRHSHASINLARSLWKISQSFLKHCVQLADLGALPETKIERTSLEQEGTEKAVFLTGSDRRNRQTRRGGVDRLHAAQNSLHLFPGWLLPQLRVLRHRHIEIPRRRAWQIVDQVYRVPSGTEIPPPIRQALNDSQTWCSWEWESPSTTMTR